MKERIGQVHDPITAKPHSLRCPFCGTYEHADHDSAHCLWEEGFLSEGLLESLHRVTAELPDIFSTRSLADTPASALPSSETPTSVFG
jgi:hypothetical protein